MSSHGLGIALFAKKSIFNKNIYFTAHNEINENLKKLGKKSYFFQLNTAFPYYIRVCHYANDSDPSKIYHNNFQFAKYLKYFNIR